jgi:2-polyprenyl-3-methyl-5-hydroxy-6-metoxy-1,4-benzoquinol methylase
MGNPMHPQPSPNLMFETLGGFQRSMALKGAIDLELFTHIVEGATTSSELARRIAANEKGVRVLCDFLAVIGFLTKHDGVYGLTPDSAVFLNKHSPAYLGAVASFIAHPSQVAHFLDMAAVVRNGGSVAGEHTVDPDDPVWVEFARSMTPIAGVTAQAAAAILARPGTQLKALDIAAGSGAFGIEILKRNAAAEFWALDWASVLALAVEHAAQAGVAGRYRTIPGNAFEADFGNGFDLILLPNFLHHFDPLTNVKLLRKVRAALAPGGRAAIIEYTPNEDRISPPVPAIMSLAMLATTTGGDAYTVPELETMLREAGFGESRTHELGESQQTLILGS